MPESTDSNSKMLEIPDVNGTDPVFTMSRAVDAGSISFRAVMQKEGGYYCSLGKDAKTNYTHQINLGFENKYGVNSTGGINGPKFITLFNVPTRFTYKMEFTATEQLHYINDILVYTSTIPIEPVDGSNHYPGLFNKTMYIDNVAILDEAGVTLLPGGVDVLDMEPYTIGESAKNTTLVTEYGLIGWNGDNTLIDFVNIVANPVKSTSELLTGNWNCTRLSVSSQAGVRESEVFSTEDVTPPGISADMFLNIAANNSGHMTRLYNTAILNETDTFDDDALFGSGTDRHPDDYTTILDGPTYRATPVSTNGSTEITLNGTTVNPAYLVYYAVSNNSINYGVPDESMNNRTYQIIELTDTTMTLSIGFETSTGVQNYWNATYNKDSTSYPLYLRILMFETYAELIADGVTSAEIRALGLSIQQLNDMGANFKELEYLDIQELLDFGVSVATLALYFTLVELKLVIDLAGLKKGFTLAELKAEFTLAELKLEFELSELKAEFTLAELMAEFELAELKAIVFSLTAEIDGGSDSNYTYMEASTDGTTFAVSNNEKQQVEVYHKVDSLWLLKGSPIAFTANTGYSVDLNSNGSVVSFGQINNLEGGVKVYRYNDASTEWELLGSPIVAPGIANTPGLGYRTKLNEAGTIVAASSPYQQDGANEIVIVSRYVDGEWSQLGNTIDNLDVTAGRKDNGYALDISANGLTLVVGARLEDSFSGIIRVFTYNDGSSLWEQKGDTITRAQLSDVDLSGSYVSMNSSGSMIAISDHDDASGAGATRIFEYDDASSSWLQIGEDIVGEADGDQSSFFGLKLSADGSTVAIGAPYNDGSGIDSGHIRVYQYVDGTWTQFGADINGTGPGNLFGWYMTMSSSADTIFADVGNNNTKINIYDKLSAFTLAELKLEFTLAELKLEFELAELKLEFELAELIEAGFTATELKLEFELAELKELFTLRELYDAGFTIVDLLALRGDINFVQLGQDIDGEAAGDASGWSVSLSADGSIVAIGAIFNNVNGSYSGHVRVYQNVSGTWTQIGQDIDGEASGDRSGISVSLSADGSIVAIGANGNDGNGSSSGHVRVYKNESGTWTQIGQDIDGEAAGDNSGIALSLSADGSIVAIGAFRNDGNGSDSGHVRVYKNVSGTWTQIGQDIDGEAEDDYSGRSVSLSADGSIVAIGAIYNDGNGNDSGHVRVYKNESGTWTQIGQDIDGEAADDVSGFSVSLSADGSIVAIGAYGNDGNGQDSGHVRVYQNVSGTWTQLGQDIDGEAGDDLSGWLVSLSADGSIVAIGAYRNDGNGTDSGHVRVYKNESGNWTQIGQDLDGEAAYDQSSWLGLSLSADGSIVAIGASFNDGNGNNSGHVRVYQKVDNGVTIDDLIAAGFTAAEFKAAGYTLVELITFGFTLVELKLEFEFVELIEAGFSIAELRAAGFTVAEFNVSPGWTQIGQYIDGEAAGDQSGSSGLSLSADGSIVAIGAPYNDGNGNDSGHVRVYKNESGNWTQIGQDIDGEAVTDRSGFSVSLSADGSIVAIGAIYNGGVNGSYSGHVRVYQKVSGTWTQIGQDIDGEAASDYSGYSVSLSNDGSIVAIGAYGNDDNGSTSGHVRVYQNVSGTWTKIGQDIDGEAERDQSGYSVSLSADGSIVAIGAPINDGNGTYSGHVRVYKNESGTWTQIGQDIDGEAIYDWSGHSVSLSADGSIVAIGAPYNDANGYSSGHVRVYQNVSGTWTQIGQDLDGEAIYDYSGFNSTVSLSADGSIVAIGARYNDGVNGPNTGHVRVYQNVSGTWTQLGQDLDGEALNAYAGYSVSLSNDGSIVAIGAPYNDSNGYASGHVRVMKYDSYSLTTPLAELVAVFTLAELKLEFELAELVAFFTLAELKDAGFPLRELFEGGFTLRELFEGGFTLRELLETIKEPITILGLDTYGDLWNGGKLDLEKSDDNWETFTDIPLTIDYNSWPTSTYWNAHKVTADLAGGNYRVKLNPIGTYSYEIKFAFTTKQFIVDKYINTRAVITETDILVPQTLANQERYFVVLDNDELLAELKEIFTLAELKLEFELAELIAAGFTLAELKLEFELAELKLEFELAELKLEFELAELVAGGFTLAELKLEFELAELMLLELFVLADFKAAGYTVAELKAGGFTIAELLAVGFTDLEIARGGFTATQMFEADINPLVFKNDVPTSEFRDFGYTCKIARLVYPIADVVSAYTSIELKNAGVNIETLVNYKKPLADIKTAYSDITTTYTPVQLKPIYTIREMSAIYSITELTDAFTLLQMNNEYSLPELLELGAYDFEQMDLDFTFPELRGKFTLRELNTVFSLVKLHTELSFKVLNGEFTLRELNKFFTLKELHTEFTLARINESFTLVEMNAEFTLKELREAFSYNQLRNEFTALELAEGNVYD